jgi:hypothetical protein
VALATLPIRKLSPRRNNARAPLDSHLQQERHK